jgi:hypothetical protein
MKGVGEILNTDIKEKKFIIDDISAIGGTVHHDGELPTNKVFDIKLSFSSNFLDLNLKLKAQFELNPSSTNEGSYYVRFIDLEEHKKVEIDEILKHSCTIKDLDTIESCSSNGQCDFSHSKKFNK